MPIAAANDVVDAVDKAYRLVKLIIADAKGIIGKKGRVEIKADLDVLRFERGNFRSVLDKIAAGNFEPSDLDCIGFLLSDTAGDVYASMQKVDKNHRGKLERRHGAGFWDKFESDVQEMKTSIRNDLADLASMRSSTKSDVEQKTEKIRMKIEKFNADLAKYCDEILPAELKT